MVRLQRQETLEATPGNCTPSPCSLAAARHAIRWKSGQVMPLSRSGDFHAIEYYSFGMQHACTRRCCAG